MSFFRVPIRHLLATTPTRVLTRPTTTPTIPVPVLSRPLNSRSYSTPPPETPPVTPNPSSIITPVVSSPSPPGTTKTQSEPSSPRSRGARSSSPSTTSLPDVPQGYQGESRTPTHIRAPLPPYVPRPPPSLPYYVQRSKTNHLPVYTVYKAHGTKKETRIRHVRGDAKALAEGLSKHLQLPLQRDAGVWVNHNIGHVMVKGHFAPEIMEYLNGQGF